VAAQYFEADAATESARKSVALYPTGMGAIFAAVRLLNQFRGQESKSILVGFPYVDTLKILQRPEWCPKGVYFFPTMDEKDMKEIEEIVAREPILGIFTEFPSNPLLSTADLRRLAKLAHENGTALVVDDTVGSYNVNTMKYKTADIVVTSLSKIFCGAGNVMGGSLVLNPEGHMYDKLVTALSPETDSFIFEDDAKALLESSKDLRQRVLKTNANASVIAQRLKAHPMVKEIYYTQFGNASELYDPFLTESKLEHGLPRYGPLLSILLHGGFPAAKTFYDSVNVAKGPSLGTSFTLTCPYALLAHYVELDFVESCGVDRNLIRISIGLEDADLVWRDFEKALSAAQSAQ